MGTTTRVEATRSRARAFSWPLSVPDRRLTNVWRESCVRRFTSLAGRRRSSGDPGPVAPPSMTLEVWTYKGLLCDFTFSAIDILLLTFLLPGPIRRCVACLLLGCRSAFLAPSDHAKVDAKDLDATRTGWWLHDAPGGYHGAALACRPCGSSTGAPEGHTPSLVHRRRRPGGLSHIRYVPRSLWRHLVVYSELYARLNMMSSLCPSFFIVGG